MRQRKRNVFLPVDHSSALLLRRMRRKRIRRKRMWKRQLPVDHPSALLLRWFRKQRLRMLIRQTALMISPELISACPVHGQAPFFSPVISIRLSQSAVTRCVFPTALAAVLIPDGLCLVHLSLFFGTILFHTIFQHTVFIDLVYCIPVNDQFSCHVCPFLSFCSISVLFYESWIYLTKKPAGS